MTVLRAERERAYALSGPSLDRYYAEMERFHERPDADMWSQYAFQDSLFATGSYFSDLERRYDRDCVSEEYLQHRVSDALEQWSMSPFSRELDFSGFCEYLLPYRVGTEEPEEWWRDFRAEFGPVLDSVVSRPGVTLGEFCEALNGLLPEQHRNYTGYPSGKPSWKPSSLKRILGGTCDDYVGLTTYLCRSYGIPATRDFTPQWGNHSQGHSWCALIQGDSSYHYMVGEPLYLAREKPFTWRLVKAYRRTTFPQRDFPGRGSRPGELPASLRNPRVQDVTRFYTDVTDLRFDSLWPEDRSRWVLLTVFDDQDWAPVAGARRRGRRVTFPDVGLNGVFLPMFWAEGRAVPAGWPLLLGADGSRRELRPDPARRRTVRLTRKFMDRRARQFADSLRGGRFELADNAAFRDALVYAVPDTPGMNFQTLPLPQDRAFRYLRYVPAPETSGNIAEIEVYDRQGNRMSGGEIIGTYRAADKFHPMRNAFDGDALSYASCSPTQKDPAWIGLDLGRAQVLEKLCYLPRTDDNFIREGEEYELYCWTGRGWSSLGRQTGRRATQELIYDDVPENALLLLRNHTKGKEERIFTYEDDKQVWW